MEGFKKRGRGNKKAKLVNPAARVAAWPVAVEKRRRRGDLGRSVMIGLERLVGRRMIGYDGRYDGRANVIGKLE